MYAKLFASLYQGTLRGRSDEILVFTNLLAFADQYGFVDKHWQAISEETGLPRERVEAAILTLESPDSESRSPELDGCRIIRMDEHRAWGWKIVNYGKYRAIRNEDDRREQTRLAQERWRKKKAGVEITIMKVSHGKPREAQGEGEGEGEEVHTPRSRGNGKQRPKKNKTLIPDDFGISERVATWCNEHQIENVEGHLTYFVGYVKASGKTYADWDQALINCIRGDWAKIGDGKRRVAL